MGDPSGCHWCKLTSHYLTSHNNNQEDQQQQQPCNNNIRYQQLQTSEFNMAPSLHEHLAICMRHWHCYLLDWTLVALTIAVHSSSFSDFTRCPAHCGFCGCGRTHPIREQSRARVHPAPPTSGALCEVPLLQLRTQLRLAPCHGIRKEKHIPPACSCRSVYGAGVWCRTLQENERTT
jgi:hypothetical protein